jgi:hypothetical protein
LKEISRIFVKKSNISMLTDIVIFVKCPFVAGVGYSNSFSNSDGICCWWRIV